MAGKIPDAAIQDVRERISIVEVVSNYVSLKRAGRNHLGLCPFHNEKTPSFTVNEERGLFHCFGCGAGGTVFTFLMRIERVEFPEAVEMLAKRAGVELPARDASSPAAAERERLVKVNRWAAKKFAEALWGSAGDPARRYLQTRGVSEEIAREYDLGYAPPRGDLIAGPLRRRAEAIRAAERVGLVGRGERGDFYDKFRARLMFPIAKLSGDIIGFGGRALTDVRPKYLNSPESPFFSKGQVLFGLSHARDAVRENDSVVVVEGYLDALALIQHGIRHVVATLGTALTTGHLERLRPLRIARVIVFFDGDGAGRAAALRAFAISAEANADVYGAFLPSGEDPDTYVRKNGASAVRELLDRAVPISDYYFEQKRPPLGASASERARSAEEAAEVLARVKVPLRRDALLSAAAQKYGVGEEVLRQACSKVRPQPVAAPALEHRGETIVTPSGPLPAAEVMLVESMARDRDVARWAAEHGAIDQFRCVELAELARSLAQGWAVGEEAVARVLDQVPVALAERLTAVLVGPVEDTGRDRLQIAADCARRIEQEALRMPREASRRALRQFSAATGDAERENELLRQVQDLRQAEEELRRRGGGPP